MSNSAKNQSTETETKRLLGEVLNEAILSSGRATPTDPGQGRRWVSIGMLLLAPFCLSATALFWIRSDLIYSGIWFCFSILLLLAGGWQLDKAAKESTNIMPVSTPNSLDSRTYDTNLKRIK